ncbi:alpha/beta fold hydrolase [Nocardioides sp. InS609-2]|uniref:alpha/beta fold hydrolase n=1 Tax=Nocardioides sp. InS609-2 TaxID=2760705 RepID=UPI0020BF05CB|nr:alpha/beta fold hydrolase [Nocardioides sp. InS609-2]
MMGPLLTSYTHDGLTFDVRDEGPADGDVIVLLHGFPQTSTSWATVVPHLHAAGFRTVAPDQRGYSPGARPSGRHDYRLDQLVGDVVALIEATGHDAVHLVGHDWGGTVAWSTAASRPEVVRTLTAVSVPHPRAMVQTFRTVRQLRKSWYMVAFQLPWLPEHVLSGRYGESFLRASGMTAEQISRYRDEVVLTGALPHALGWYRAMLLPTPRGLGRRVSVPTTHVWSDGDTAIAREGAELTASYVEADYHLEVLEGVSHWIPEEAPEELAAEVIRRARSV